MKNQKTVAVLIALLAFQIVACQNKKSTSNDEQQNQKTTSEQVLKELNTKEKSEALALADQALESFVTIQTQADAQSDLCLFNEEPVNAKILFPEVRSYSLAKDQDAACPVSLNMTSKVLITNRSKTKALQTSDFTLNYSILDPNAVLNFTFRSAKMTGHVTLNAQQKLNFCEITVVKTISGTYSAPSLSDNTKIEDHEFQIQEQTLIQKSIGSLRYCDFSSETIQNDLSKDTGDIIKKTNTKKVYLKKLGAEIIRQKVSNRKKILQQHLFINKTEILPEDLKQIEATP